MKTEISDKNEVYERAYQKMIADKGLNKVTMMAGCHTDTLRTAKFKRQTPYPKTARKIIQAMCHYGYLPEGTDPMQVLPPRNPTKHDVRSVSLRQESNDRLARLWIEWNVSPLIIKDLYNNGCPEIKRQAAIFRLYVPIAPKRTGPAVEMRDFARDWVEKQEVRT